MEVFFPGGGDPSLTLCPALGFEKSPVGGGSTTHQLSHTAFLLFFLKVPQLLLILGAAERRVQEAEAQAQHFQTAMRLLELERVSEREELELRCAIRMEDYRKRVFTNQPHIRRYNHQHVIMSYLYCG